jgi:hypothetical protein
MVIGCTGSHALTQSPPSHLVLDAFPREAKSGSRRGPMYAWGEGLYANFVQPQSNMRWEGETFDTKPTHLLELVGTKKPTG